MSSLHPQSFLTPVDSEPDMSYSRPREPHPGLSPVILASLAPAIIPATAADQAAINRPEMTGPWKKDPVRRSQPDDAGVPAEFVAKLSARGCTIPQYDGLRAMDDRGTGASNVIHGEFARHGQEDWAVLCSKGRSSTIIIFWGKPTRVPLRWRDWTTPTT